MVEKEMQRLPMHEWSTDDQDMLIELFEKQVSQQDSQHDSQQDSQQEQSFQSTSTNPQQHHKITFQSHFNHRGTAVQQFTRCAVHNADAQAMHVDGNSDIVRIWIHCMRCIGRCGR